MKFAYRNCEFLYKWYYVDTMACDGLVDFSLFISEFLRNDSPEHIGEYDGFVVYASSVFVWNGGIA